MPAAKRRRTIVEEISETPTEKEKEVRTPHKHAHTRVEEVTEAVEKAPEVVHEVAKYDEPPLVDAEIAARKLLEMDEKPMKHINLKLVFLVTILTALIVGFIAGGVYVYITGISGTQTAKPTQAPVETIPSTPTSNPSPTPKSVVKYDTYTVNILNGSGVIGAALKVKVALEAAGFKITGTGNALNYNFISTVVSVKPSISSDVVEALKKALKDYVVEEGDALSASNKFDIVVTAGKK